MRQTRPQAPLVVYQNAHHLPLHVQVALAFLVRLIGPRSLRRKL